MLTLNQLMNFPGQFGHRQNSISKVKIHLLDVQDSEKILIIGGISNSQRNTQYAQKIEIQKTDNKLTLQNQVRILCSCQSFKYEFAGSLLKINSLLESEFFEYMIQKHKPKKKNVFQTPSGCKHIIALARTLWKNQNLSNFGLISNVNLQRKYMFLSNQVSMNNWNPRDPYQQSNRQKILQQQRQQSKLKNIIQ